MFSDTWQCWLSQDRTLILETKKNSAVPPLHPCLDILRSIDPSEGRASKLSQSQLYGELWIIEPETPHLQLALSPLCPPVAAMTGSAVGQQDELPPTGQF